MKRSFQADRWDRVFLERQLYPFPMAGIPAGAQDSSPHVLRILRVAAAMERIGVDVLVEESRNVHDPAEARCIAHHAREEASHVQLLEQLLGDSGVSRLSGLLGVAEGYVTRRRPAAEQMLVTLLVEAMGIALYEMLAEQLGPGRVAAVFESIVDDERVHADLTREILLAAVADLSPRTTRRLRRIRTVTVAMFVIVHAFLHRTYFRPLGIGSASKVRGRMLREIERTLRGIPALAVPVSR
jgi:rubrerythrin